MCLARGPQCSDAGEESLCRCATRAFQASRECLFENHFFLFLNQSTNKNHLNVHFKHMFKLIDKQLSEFYAKCFAYLHFEPLLLQYIKTGLQIRVRIVNLFSYFSSQTHVVGTQKNHLNETVLLSTQNTGLN